MYLKSIEICGFKSFANKIVFEFHNGITGIVGPNGSGKSNVADAVRWVLGEQKIKQLRGVKMEDVIFSGTENRKPLGFAYVAITLDNSVHELDIDFEEVTVSRRLYRSGESEYMINGATCRLKDINELFYDTGIGKEGYSIIGQGQIDKILSSKPEDRRELFDEAAGIVKFKRRKNESLKKLNDDNQNLVRLSDILGEIEGRIEPLSKQSETAQKYLRLRDQLRTYDINMFLIEAESIREKTAAIESDEGILNGDLLSAQEELKNAKREYESLDEQIDSVTKEIEGKRSRASENELNVQKNEGKIMLLNEQINLAKAEKERYLKSFSSLESRIKEAEAEREKCALEKAEIEKKISEKSSVLGESDANASNARSEALAASEAAAAVRAQIIDLLNEKSAVNGQIERANTQLEQIRLLRSQYDDEIDRFKAESKKQEEIISSLSEDIKQLDERLLLVKEELEENEKDHDAESARMSGVTKSLEEGQAALANDRSRLDLISGITERYEGYAAAVRKIMDLRETNPGIIGVVADIIKTEKRFELAIETALGGAVQNIVTRDEDCARDLIAYLKENKAGRATFLPLTTLKVKSIQKDSDLLKEDGAIGWADDLVGTDDEYAVVAKHLLSGIMVVDSVENALKIERKCGFSQRIVTLEGEYINRGGAMSGGAFKNAGNLLGRRRQIDELKKAIGRRRKENEALSKRLSDCRDSIDLLENRRAELLNEQSEKTLLKNSLGLNLEKANEKIADLKENRESFIEKNSGYDALSSDIVTIKDDAEKRLGEILKLEEEHNRSVGENDLKAAALTARADEIAAQSNLIRISLSSLNEKHEFAQENIRKAEKEASSLSEQLSESRESYADCIDENEKREQAAADLKKENAALLAENETINGEIGELLSRKESLSAEHKDFFEKREEITDRINDLDKQIFRLASKKERLNENYEGKVEYMWNEYEITYGAALKLRDETLTKESEIKSAINRIKKEIKELGDVNVNAVEEYRQLSERYEFMKKQYDDLMAAREDLLKIISELDAGMRTRFKEQFALVSSEFDKVFKELFGGGKGTIELTEADDILDAGIEIIAQPPGKKLQNMLQLSGGEKALTAICLLFAIQSLKPSPFCILDEIEAALDGSNVTRFAQYLHKLTKNTQFIVITHRRGTMAAADRLYGITMQEKGISALVSVDLADGAVTDDEIEDDAAAGNGVYGGEAAGRNHG